MPSDLDSLIAKMCERCEKATPGPWKANKEQDHVFTGPGYAKGGCGPYTKIAGALRKFNIQQTVHLRETT